MQTGSYRATRFAGPWTPLAARLVRVVCASRIRSRSLPIRGFSHLRGVVVTTTSSRPPLPGLVPLPYQLPPGPRWAHVLKRCETLRGRFAISRPLRGQARCADVCWAQAPAGGAAPSAVSVCSARRRRVRACGVRARVCRDVARRLCRVLCVCVCVACLVCLRMVRGVCARGACGVCACGVCIS